LTILILADVYASGSQAVVLFNTGSGYKYLEAWQAALAG
jgi:hypothetical protein